MKMDFVLSQTTEYAFSESLKRLIKSAEENIGEEYIVIVPETKTLFAERTLLSCSKRKAFSNIYVYSFSRLLKRLQTRQVYPLNKEAGVMIVRNLIMELLSDLVCYKKTALTVGFAENIYETIQQLKSSAISPIELSESAKKCPPALKIKLEDIALIYDAYENYIGGEFADANDKLVMLEKEIVLSERIKNSNIYVLGFDSLTSSMAAVVKSMVKNAKSVTVSAPFMHKELKNSHITDNEVFEKFKAIADSLNIKNYNPIVINKPLEKDFKHIFDNLYCYPASKKVCSGQIEFYGCQSPYEEARKVASLIKEDILRGKYRYKDICVYLANESMKSHIESALEEFDVPYFSASPYEFETHPLFSFIKLLFQLVRKNFESDDVLSFSKIGLLEIDASKLDNFENYVLKYGINHLRFLKPFTISDDLQSDAEEVRGKIIDIVQKFSANYNENLTINELVEVLFAFFDEIDIKKRLENLKKTQNKFKDMRYLMASEQAETKVNEVLQMLSQFLGSRKIKLDDFYTLLISGLEAADISLIPLGIDNVQVVSNADGLFDIKCMYVLGATDGNFPRREQDLGLIQDEDIGAIEGISEKKIEPTIRTINRRERYKVFQLLLLAKNKLVLSFSEKADNGEEEKMSALVLSLMELFLNEDNTAKEETRVVSPFKEGSAEELAYSIGSKKVAVNYLAEKMSQYRAGIDYDAGEKNISALYHALDGSLTKTEQEAFDNINSVRSDDFIKNAKQLFFTRGTTSISELETYFTCPFKHFVSYGLRLKERPMASLRALDIGDILHALAEEFVEHYKRVQTFDPEKVAVNLLNKIIEREKYNEEENMTLINILKEEGKRLCVNLYSQFKISSFVPYKAEMQFGGKGASGIPLLDSPKISIVGKIDRCDETDEFYRIIDYKTGEIETRPEDIYYGKKLQLAVYLSALSSLKKKPAGVLYFPIHNDYGKDKEDAKDAYRMRGFMLGDIKSALAMDPSVDFSSPKSHIAPFKILNNKDVRKTNEKVLASLNSILSEGELESMRQYALAISKNAVEEILEGYYKASPFKNSNRLPCEYCDYKNICSINSMEHKSVRVANVKDAKEFFKGGRQWQK